MRGTRMSRAGSPEATVRRAGRGGRSEAGRPAPERREPSRAARAPRRGAGPAVSPADLTPPFALPGEHFAAGLLWLALGSAGLVAVAPTLARGGFLDPRAVAVTHCFTLGWITTSIFGALYQIYPVALGVAARSVRAGHVTFWVLQAGTALLVAGAWWWRPALLAVGWVVLFFAVGGMSWNLLPQRRKARRGRLVGLYVSAGHMGLGLAMFVVAASVGVFQGWWGANRLGILSAHVHLAVVGFATLTAVGVGSKLLPMFLLSRRHAVWPLAWIGPLAFVGLVVFAAGEIWDARGATLVGGALVAAGIALYLYLAAGYFLRRTRRPAGAPMLQVALAHLFLAAATGVGLTLLAGRGGGSRLPVVYGVLGVLGWLTLLVAGVYGKIVPFLSWLARFSSRVGERGVPTASELTSAPRQGMTVGLLTAGVALLAHGVGAGSAAAATAGAGLFAAGVLVLAADGLRLILPALPAQAEAARRARQTSGGPGRRGGPGPAITKNRTRENRSPTMVRTTERNRATLDVRPILAAGREPLPTILEAAAAIPHGGELEVIASFEPVPLYRVLSRQGFGHRTESRGPTEWVVRFRRTGVTPSATASAVHESHPRTAGVLAAHGVDLCCGGGKPLEFVAAAHGVELDGLLAELQEAALADDAPADAGDCGCGGACGGR